MNLSLNQDTLRIELEWYEQLWAVHLQQAITLPVRHILSATTAEPQSSWKEIRAPGTFVPGVIKAGTYYTGRGREFWYVTEDRNYLVLSLQDEYYNRIVLTKEGSQQWVDRIHQAIADAHV